MECDVVEFLSFFFFFSFAVVLSFPLGSVYCLSYGNAIFVVYRERKPTTSVACLMSSFDWQGLRKSRDTLTTIMDLDRKSVV